MRGEADPQHGVLEEVVTADGSLRGEQAAAEEVRGREQDHRHARPRGELEADAERTPARPHRPGSTGVLSAVVTTRAEGSAGTYPSFRMVARTACASVR